jgi:hypothetical protein
VTYGSHGNRSRFKSTSRHLESSSRRREDSRD